VKLSVEHDRPLSPLTTLGLGGPARHFVQASSRELLCEALAWAKGRAMQVGILGGGSNLVVNDSGFDGLVVQLATRGVEMVREHGTATLTVQAGEPWDDIVELAVSERLAGLECLTGIPGTTGATPIQNVGAYGQEVSDVIESVEVLDRMDGVESWLSPSACDFAYRSSRFKRLPGRFVVLAVRFRLHAEGAPCTRYGELARAFAASDRAPSLQQVQQAVRALRAQKGMLIDAHWEPSAGSFFTNPTVSAEEAERVVAVALARGLVASGSEVPRFASAAGSVKLAAAWLVERAGIRKGLRRGAVGVSTRHALALVHHGGGNTRDLMALAAEIQQQVDSVFGVNLTIEPVRW
jgi:UDP-N-acetylmuramate dehydrogenase